MSVEQENLNSEDSIQPPAYWPASGDIQVEGLSAKYSPEGPWVLRNISFHLKPGERVGIGELIWYFERSDHLLLVVGRTGSGKVERSFIYV